MKLSNVSLDLRSLLLSAAVGGMLMLSVGAATTTGSPTVAKWEASAPKWAEGRWEQVKVSLSSWCEEQKIPLVIEDNAWVEFDEM